MALKISKRVEFEAAHQLTKLPEEHKCARLHGHNYVVDVEFEGTMLNEADMLIDFGSVSAVIRNRYDHRNLNDFPEFRDNPTAEAMCMVFVDLIDRELLQPTNMNVNPKHWTKLVRLRVYETPDCWAEWTP